MSRVAEGLPFIALVIAICITACKGQDAEIDGTTVDWSGEEDDFWTERSSQLSQAQLTVSPTESTKEEDSFQTSIIFTNLYIPGEETTGLQMAQEATTYQPIETSTNDSQQNNDQENVTEELSSIRNLSGSNSNSLVSRDSPKTDLSNETVPATSTSIAGLADQTENGEANFTKISSSELTSPKAIEEHNFTLGALESLPYFSPYDADHSKYLEDAHPCRRECLHGSPPMICHYNFTLEWYHTMSKACYDCPYNLSDCYRPDCIAADGMKRIIATINRRLPGPSIEVCLGDTIVVRVDNRLGESTTSLHWHGLPQVKTPHMDGVPFVTQCPILPGSTFVYSFNASDPGTHFYHSHSGIQRGDGAFGSMVIRKPEVTELYDLDLGEHTMIVLDWSHGAGTALLSGHLHAGGGNKPDTLQINGRGRYANFPNNLTTPLATFSVTKGFKYRFRLINAGVMNCPIELSIDDHQLLIISADGNDILPEKVDRLVSYAGERWDFVVTADAAVGNYWIKARGLMDCDERFTLAHQEAILHYTGAISLLPDSRLSYDDTRRSGKVMNELNAGRLDPSLSAVELEALRQSPDPALAEKVDRKLVFSYDFHPKDNPHFFKPNLYGFKQVKDVSHKIFTPQLNHVSMKLPPFPMLTQSSSLQPEDICSNQNQTGCALSYCECVNIINIKLNDVVEIILIDEGETYDANHPFHLHGHSFRVIGMDRLGRNTSTAAVLALDANGAIYRNLNNPPIKDTVTVPDGGYTIIRFHANNPGYWLFHCHIEFHVEVGMAVVLKVGEDSDMIRPPPGFPKCGDYDPDESESDETEELPKKEDLQNKIINLPKVDLSKVNNFSELTTKETTRNKFLDETVVSINESTPTIVMTSTESSNLTVNKLVPIKSSVKTIPISPKQYFNVSENEIIKRPYFRGGILRGSATESRLSVSRYRSSASQAQVSFLTFTWSVIQLLLTFKL